MAKTLAAAGIVKPLLMLGLPDKFIDHGDPVKLTHYPASSASCTAAGARSITKR